MVLLLNIGQAAKDERQRGPERRPYRPVSDEDWRACFAVTCEHCARLSACPIIERMIEARAGGAWPAEGWVTDPGAEVTCLSYEPKPRTPMPRQQRRAVERMGDAALPPMCGGCAARKGSEASVSLHTQRDFQAAVRDRAAFVCHEDPAKQQLCSGWCRAIKRRAA